MTHDQAIAALQSIISIVLLGLVLWFFAKDTE